MTTVTVFVVPVVIFIGVVGSIVISPVDISPVSIIAPVEISPVDISPDRSVQVRMSHVSSDAISRSGIDSVFEDKECRVEETHEVKFVHVRTNHPVVSTVHVLTSGNTVFPDSLATVIGVSVCSVQVTTTVFGAVTTSTIL